jgi:hypothetical protein
MMFVISKAAEYALGGLSKFVRRYKRIMDMHADLFLIASRKPFLGHSSMLRMIVRQTRSLRRQADIFVTAKNIN